MRYLFALFCLALFFLHCSSPHSTLQCIPNDTQACLCVGRLEGVQICSASGDKWEQCQCLSGKEEPQNLVEISTEEPQIREPISLDASNDAMPSRDESNSEPTMESGNPDNTTSCDGEPRVGTPCKVGRGVCAVSSSYACSSNGTTHCLPKPEDLSKRKVEDICNNGLDDNCSSVQNDRCGWGFFFGARIDFNFEKVKAVQVDSDGNILLAGQVRGGELSGFKLPSGDATPFVAKFSPQGTLLSLIWVGTSSGPNSIEAFATASDGSIYIVGQLHTAGYFDNITITNKVKQTMYIAKIKADGKFEWVRSVDDAVGMSWAYDIKLHNGALYVSGWREKMIQIDGVKFEDPLGVRSGQFLAKFDTKGKILWGKDFSQGLQTYTRSFLVPFGQDIYFAGSFHGEVDFGGILLTSFEFMQGNKYVDMFISKFDENGKVLWAKSIGQHDEDFIEGAAVDSKGNVTIIGRGAANTPFQINGAFVAQFDNNGKVLWSKNLGDGISRAKVKGLYVSSSDHIFLTGSFENRMYVDLQFSKTWQSQSKIYSTFCLDNSDPNNKKCKDRDAFFMKLSSSGDFLWASNVGGPNQDEGQGIAVSLQNDVYIIGEYGIEGFGCQNSFDCCSGATCITSNIQGSCRDSKCVFKNHFANFQENKTIGHQFFLWQIPNP